MKTLFRLLKSFKKEFVLGPIFKLLEAIFELLTPILMAKIIDVGIKNNDRDFIIRYGIYLIVLAFVGYGCSLVCQYFASRASQKYGTVLRDTLYEKILLMPQEQSNAFGVNSLVTRMNNDINQLQLAVAMFIRLVVRAPFIVIGSIVMAFTIDVKLAIIFVGVSMAIALILYFIMQKSIPFYQKIQKQLDYLSILTRENLVGGRVIRAFSKQVAQIEKFTVASQESKTMMLYVGKIEALLNPLVVLTISTGIALVIWFGANHVFLGTLTQGEIIALVNYLMQISLALIVVANLVVIFTKAAASAQRVGEVLDVPNVLVDGTKQIVQQQTEQIVFDHVTFRFPGAKYPMLQDIDFKIHEHQHVGIIGGTGAGKSTLIKLLTRFYDVTEGAIYVNGENIRTYQTKELRQYVNIISQKATLFTGTIRDNICMGKPDATTEEIWHALDIAQATEFVQKLPHQLETQVNQGGKNFSGGQKQRLNIARSILAHPQVLIFDDSSSALDYATDAAMRQSIAANLQHTTIITVSQRISAISHADLILVLDQGTVQGQGTHQELLETCLLYQEIATSQLNAEEVNQ